MNNISDESSEIVISKKVIEMLTVANEYCLFVEKISQYKTKEIQLYFSRLAPLLYLKGSLLPELELNEEDANERFVTEEEWLSIYKVAKEKFNEENVFSDADNTNPLDAELLQFDVAEIIADIYQDLKDFILLYQKDTVVAKENAVYWCAYYFKNNWGKKLILLLKTMHFNLYNSIV